MFFALNALGLFGTAGCAAKNGFAALETRSGYFQAEAGKLFYEVAGRGPVVTLIHGGQMDRRLWDEQFALLAQEFRVIRYDVRGYGRSAQASKPYANYEELRALLKHLGVERTSLVGLSLGGQIAVDFAIAYPSMVDKLLPVAPGLSGFDWSADGNERLRRIIEAAQDGDDAQAADLWLTDPMMAGVNENPQLRARVRQYLLDNRQVWLLNWLLEKQLRPPAAERLGVLRVPTLVVVGDRDIPDIQRVADLLAAEAPHARKIVVPGASHIVNLEKPEAFNQILLEFLRGSDKTVAEGAPSSS